MKAFMSASSQQRMRRPARVTVRIVDNAVDAERLLPLPVLNRLCFEDVPNRVRQYNLYRSHVVVALDGDSVVGFAAFKPTNGTICVAHELWVDRHARAGLAPVTEAMLAAVEAAVRQAGCSRLFIVTVQATPVRRILQLSGYTVSLSGSELIWLEKTFVGDGVPLRSA